MQASGTRILRATSRSTISVKGLTFGYAMPCHFRQPAPLLCNFSPDLGCQTPSAGRRFEPTFMKDYISLVVTIQLGITRRSLYQYEAVARTALSRAVIRTQRPRVAAAA